MGDTCSVCSSPVQVRNTINDQLRQGARLRDIASQCGISKSAIHRHRTKCVPRELLQAHRKAKLTDSRIVAHWPTDETAPAETRGNFVLWNSGEVIAPSEVTADDLIFEIQYAAPVQPPKTAKTPPDTPPSPAK